MLKTNIARTVATGLLIVTTLCLFNTPKPYRMEVEKIVEATNVEADKVTNVTSQEMPQYETQEQEASETTIEQTSEDRAEDASESSNISNDNYEEKPQEEEQWVEVDNNTSFRKLGDDKAMVKMVKPNATETYEMTFYDTYFIVNSVASDNAAREQQIQKEVGMQQLYSNNPRVNAVKNRAFGIPGND